MSAASVSTRPPLAWLRAPGSLTRHLARVCPGRLVVEVRAEAWGRAEPRRARLLGLRPHARVWRREVCLACRYDGELTPYVYAITLSSPGAWQRLGLARLGRRPLATLLFRPGVRRLRRIFLAPGRRRPRWARCSVFVVRGHRLLVEEAFLDGLPPLRR